jgi:hypothetical protein
MLTATSARVLVPSNSSVAKVTVRAVPSTLTVMVRSLSTLKSATAARSWLMLTPRRYWLIACISTLMRVEASFTLLSMKSGASSSATVRSLNRSRSLNSVPSMTPARRV